MPLNAHSTNVHYRGILCIPKVGTIKSFLGHRNVHTFKVNKDAWSIQCKCGSFEKRPWAYAQSCH